MAATLANAPRTGYINEYGKPIGNNVGKWFEYGVKITDKPVKKGICTTKQTLYVFLFVIGFIILAAVIIIPVVLGVINK